MIKKEMPWDDILDLFREHNRNESGDAEPLVAYIVYDQSNFKTPYSEESRTYRVDSRCKMFHDGMISNSLTGDCLDHTEYGVRLDWYNWKVEYCYMLIPDEIEF